MTAGHHFILTTATASSASISSLVTSCTDVVGRSRHFAIFPARQARVEEQRLVAVPEKFWKFRHITSYSPPPPPAPPASVRSSPLHRRRRPLAPLRDLLGERQAGVEEQRFVAVPEEFGNFGASQGVNRPWSTEVSTTNNTTPPAMSWRASFSSKAAAANDGKPCRMAVSAKPSRRFCERDFGTTMAFMAVSPDPLRQGR